MLMGAALLPLLPIDRSSRAEAAERWHCSAPARQRRPPVRPDQARARQIRRAASIGSIAPSTDSCAPAAAAPRSSCPPGTSPSPITWIGTCHNPADGRDYIVSYNDCCGKTSCGNCECNRNEREKPMYRLSRNNDVNWCMANADSNYHCSVSVILGVAEQ
jgi:methylamine dehydrogenase light chain